MDSIPQKRCSSCGQIFPNTKEFFFANKRSKSGLMAACKTCAKKRHNKYKEANRDKINAINRDWHKRNPNKQKEYDQKRYGTEKYRAQRRRYHHEHKEQRSEYSHNYYIKNRDAILMRNKLWHDNNRDFFRIRIQKRRHKERQGNFTLDDWRKALDYWHNKCAVCGKGATLWTVIAIDHWKPLAKGGEHSPLNIIPLCHAKPGVPNGEPCCNNSKGYKDAYQWLVKRFGKRFANKKLREIERYFQWVKDNH